MEVSAINFEISGTISIRPELIFLFSSPHHRNQTSSGDGDKTLGYFDCATEPRKWTRFFKGCVCVVGLPKVDLEQHVQ